jgi:ELWxxDGT repeat protein
MKRGTAPRAFSRAMIQPLEARVLLSAAYLVKDLNPGTLDSRPVYLTPFDNALYFVANDGMHGQELMRYDGTSAGITLVKDINPGPAGSISTALVVSNGSLYFGAWDPVNGNALWKSDGTAAGTAPVKSLNHDAAGQGSRVLESLTAANGKIFFVTGSSELWISDGTTAGTFTLGSYLGVTMDPIVALGNKVFFAGGGYGLYSSDGTVAGTRPVGNFSIVPHSLTSVGDSLYFLSASGATNSLWQSDGTKAGTHLIAPVGVTLNSDTITAAGGNLYFAATDPLHGLELWKSDGTAAGTGIVRDINPGKSDSAPIDMIDFNGTLLFAANDATGQGLWKTDGTDAGTVLVKRVNMSLAAPNDPLFRVELVQGDIMYFTANDVVHGWQLWKTDGTPAGTTMFDDINPYGSSGPNGYAVSGETICFSADDGLHGQELWQTDGTAGGTQLVQDLNTNPASSNPFGMTALNGGKIIFDARDAHGAEPWVSDGTAAGTYLLKDIMPVGSSLPVDFTNVNGTVYFAAYDGAIGGLWKTDGTLGGTVEVFTTHSPNAHVDYNSLVNVNGTLFFGTSDGTLWKTDGTPAGTVRITQLPYIEDVLSLGNKVYFDDGRNVYSNDGTKAGTSLLASLNWVGSLANVNGMLYFSGVDNRGEAGIWRSDGTSRGTTEVKTLSSFTNGDPFPGDFASVNGSVLFFSDLSTSSGLLLWRSDGTDAGTIPIKTLGVNVQMPTSVAVAGGLLYFDSTDPTHGTELWESDGTTGGTHIVTDINAGTASSSPTALTPVGDLLYFSADDGVHGRELWRTDGTPAGTFMVQDINPGAAGSNPKNLSLISGTLHFAADDGAHGTELWAQDVTGGIAGSLLRAPGRGNRARGVAGVTVFLDANHNGIPDPGELRATTDAQGRYAFDNLLPGTYAVSLIPPAGNDPPIPAGTVLVRPGNITNASVFLARRIPHGRRPYDLARRLDQGF